MHSPLMIYVIQICNIVIWKETKLSKPTVRKAGYGMNVISGIPDFQEKPVNFYFLFLIFSKMCLAINEVIDVIIILIALSWEDVVSCSILGVSCFLSLLCVPTSEPAERWKLRGLSSPSPNFQTLSISFQNDSWNIFVCYFLCTLLYLFTGE